MSGAGELGPTEKRARNRVNIEITLFFVFERVGDWLNAATVGVTLASDVNNIAVGHLLPVSSPRVTSPTRPPSPTMPLANIESYAKDGAVADKADPWTYPETSDGWYRIHNTIKAEMAKFSAGIAACKSPLEAWQVEALQAYWKGHSDLTHDHHKHEDEMFTPMLKEKVNYPEKLEADHDAHLKMMAGVDSAVAALAAGGDVAALVTVFDPYRKTMEAHLKEEEENWWPLMFAYFEPGYVGNKVQEFMKSMGKTRVG